MGTAASLEEEGAAQSVCQIERGQFLLRAEAGVTRPFSFSCPPLNTLFLLAPFSVSLPADWAGPASKNKKHSVFSVGRVNGRLLGKELSRDVLSTNLVKELELQTGDRFAVLGEKNLAVTTQVPGGHIARDFQINTLVVVRRSRPRTGNEDRNVGEQIKFRFAIFEQLYHDAIELEFFLPKLDLAFPAGARN